MRCVHDEHVCSAIVGAGAARYAQRMRAAMLHSYGFEGLAIEELDDPTPGPGEVVVRTHRTSLNPVDLETVAGDNKMLLPKRLPFVPGVDVAGVVHRLGEGVSNLAEGDRVVGYTGVPSPGAFTTHAVLPAHALAPVPDAVSLEHAAAVSLAGLAGWQSLDALRLDRGARVLVHGAAGAVGSVATQLAIDRGHEVITNVHGRDAERVRRWGATQVVAYDQTRFEDVVSSVDGVVDTVGGDTFKRSLAVLRPGGTLASLKAIPHPRVLRSAGFKVPWLLGPVFGLLAAPQQKRGVRIEPIVTRPNGAALAEVMALVAAGAIAPRVETTIELEDVGRTLAAMKQGRQRGKVVVTLG